MKHLFIASALAFSALLLSACTDDDLMSHEMPAHCSDGLLNNGELDVDCGGECNDCTTLESPCNPDSNKIVLDSSLVIPFPNGTYTYSSIFTSANTGYYEVEATNNTMYAYVRWYGGRPTQQRVYLLGGTYYLNGFYNEGQANIRLWHQTTGNKAVSSSGKLYVKPLLNGKLLITFCDVRFVSEISTSTVVYNGISGRLTVN